MVTTVRLHQHFFKGQDAWRDGHISTAEGTEYMVSTSVTLGNVDRYLTSQSYGHLCYSMQCIYLENCDPSFTQTEGDISVILLLVIK